MTNPSIANQFIDSPFIQEEDMPGKILNHVPGLLEKRGLTVPDLMFGARLASGTAYSWADKTKLPKRIDLPTLARICDFLDVDVGEVLEYIPDK